MFVFYENDLDLSYNPKFQGMHMLPDEIEKIEGGANFRQVVGFPVFGVAQPSLDGMKNILEKVKASGDDKTNKEPNVQPFI